MDNKGYIELNKDGWGFCVVVKDDGTIGESIWRLESGTHLRKSQYTPAMKKILYRLAVAVLQDI